MAEISSTRTAFVEALTELIEKDDKVVMVSADSVAVFRATGLQKQYPGRIVECGIAEGSAVMISAGLASAGMKPFVCAYAGFLTMRAVEQMRTFVAYPHLNVKFFGANAGMCSGEREGVTHQFFEDVGIMRAVPGFTVLAPYDAEDTKAMVYKAYETDGPVYCRIGSGRDPVVGGGFVKREYGSDALIIGCGAPLADAMEAADVLKDEGINATVLGVNVIKPLDEDALLPYIEKAKKVITIEDHNIYGGLGSAVCEIAGRKVTRLGLQDVYPESGTAQELKVKYHIAAEDVIKAVKA
ncbi:MAG: transketolase [Clostridiales bacterium]|nr:transketolase [Clostridiales bacterium]